MYISELFIAFVCFVVCSLWWWYVWCIEWASGNQEEVQACLVTLWLFIVSCYSLYKTTLGLLCSWFENNPYFHKYSTDQKQIKLKIVMNKHKSKKNKIKLIYSQAHVNGTDHHLSESCCDFIYIRYVYIYIWVVYNFCLFCCLFIIVRWWYVWCIEWASDNQEEVQACLVTLWLFIISCYSSIQNNSRSQCVMLMIWK